MLDLAIIICPVIGYIPQYSSIKRTKSTKGFSKLTCLILLTANILRLVFWLGARFDLTLVWQSLVMIIAQLLLLNLIIATDNRPPMPFTRAPFWQWTSYSHYLAFLLAFALAGLFALLQFGIVDLLGTLALLIEAALGLPTFFNNRRLKSVEGLSVEMILGWGAGDAFKTWFFVSENAPWQFVLCGCLQLFVDFLILLQIYKYKK